MAGDTDAEKRTDELKRRAARGGRTGRGKGCGKGSQHNSDKRDAKGVRKSTYTNAAARGQDTRIPEELTECLCDMMRRGIFGEIQTEGGDIVTRGTRGKCPSCAELQREISEYIDYINEHKAAGLLPDVEGLALWLGTDRRTLSTWEKTGEPGAVTTIKATKNAIAAYKKQLALAGKIPSVVFAIDFNNNHGYTQTQQIEIESTKKLDELPTKQEIIDSLPQKNDKIDDDPVITI